MLGSVTAATVRRRRATCAATSGRLYGVDSDFDPDSISDADSEPPSVASVDPSVPIDLQQTGRSEQAEARNRARWRPLWNRAVAGRSPAAATWAVVVAMPRWVLRISLPLLAVAAVLHASPYRTTIQGVPLRIQASVFTRPGFSADTTIGDWVFPSVDGLPIGVHVAPEN